MSLHRKLAMHNHLGRSLMRFVISAIGAALVLSFVNATPRVAQAQSMSQAFNACLDLAMQRGWSRADLEDNILPARNFVINCMQGGKARAQKQKSKKAQKTQR
jgi:hypothetical protein